jgi:hypothetical protein
VLRGQRSLGRTGAWLNLILAVPTRILRDAPVLSGADACLGPSVKGLGHAEPRLGRAPSALSRFRRRPQGRRHTDRWR